MKKISLLCAVGLIISLNVNAQKQFPETFETANDTADWEMFENGTTNPDNFIVVENPDKSGINESDSCLQFTVVDEAQPWAGAFSSSFGDIEITDNNFILTMMVNKNVTSRCLIKLEKADDTFVEVFVENSSLDEWELLEFDFYDNIGETFTTIVFFPDFPEAREAGSLCFVDNIGWEGSEVPSALKEQDNINVRVYPNPSSSYIIVESENDMATINIIDLAGKNLLTIENIYNKNAQVGISDFKSGLYILTIKEADGKVVSRKIQIK
ncbi:MAG: T9SS type A sorting domain-containing protein [Salinivirgaceae bacterium]|nr:T9SS type A sorting domain-containing protein [Salinivirgaceae bacterium]